MDGSLNASCLGALVGKVYIALIIKCPIINSFTVDMLFNHCKLNAHAAQSDNGTMDRVAQDTSLLETYIFQLQLHHAMVPLKSLKNYVIQDFSLSKRTLKVRKSITIVSYSLIHLPSMNVTTYRAISIPYRSWSLNMSFFNLPWNPHCPFTFTHSCTHCMYITLCSHTAIRLCLVVENHFLEK